jgi:3'-phosphoadenosine 5'-phosphosulfate sulfotransferase (PAPS reductase)/FAD synthetase
VIETWQLQQRQSLPLQAKIVLSQDRIRKWYSHWNGDVYVSFSGGKDSTVLLDLVRSIYPDVPAVFVDTGLEYPEIREFVKTIDNVIWIKPKMRFDKVIEKYGYPVVSKENAQKIFEIKNTKSDKLRNKRLYGDVNGSGKLPEKWKSLVNAPFKVSHMCCNKIKKEPVKRYEKESNRKPIVGTMAENSRLRKTSYLQHGCNAFDSKRPMSTPIAFWTEEDIWNYIKEKELSYSKIYDIGYKNTGCMFCMFGVHLEKQPNKFQLMQETHPKQYDYCINKLGCGKVMDYINVPYKNIDDVFFTIEEE